MEKSGRKRIDGRDEQYVNVFTDCIDTVYSVDDGFLVSPLLVVFHNVPPIVAMEKVSLHA